MDIYKGPSVYKSGVSAQEVKDIVSSSEWIDVSNKIGVLNVSNPSNIRIYYNSTLSLIFIRLYARFDSIGTGKRVVYSFKNDLPGINSVSAAGALFYFDGPSYIESYKSGCIFIFPYSVGNELEKRITVDGSSFQEAIFSATIRFNSALREDFENYLNSH